MAHRKQLEELDASGDAFDPWQSAEISFDQLVKERVAAFDIDPTDSNEWDTPLHPVQPERKSRGQGRGKPVIKYQDRPENERVYRRAASKDWSRVPMDYQHETYNHSSMLRLFYYPLEHTSMYDYRPRFMAMVEAVLHQTQSDGEVEAGGFRVKFIKRQGAAQGQAKWVEVPENFWLHAQYDDMVRWWQELCDDALAEEASIVTRTLYPKYAATMLPWEDTNVIAPSPMPEQVAATSRREPYLLEVPVPQPRRHHTTLED